MLKNVNKKNLMKENKNLFYQISKIDETERKIQLFVRKKIQLRQSL